MFKFGDRVKIMDGFFEGVEGMLFNVMDETGYSRKYLMIGESVGAEDMEIEVKEDQIVKLEGEFD